MKQHDFDRLKAICEKEGYEFAITSTDTGNDKVLVLIEKKDIWEGVEYCRNRYNGICSPISRLGTLKYDNGRHIFKDHNEPITQQAYEEYLKKEAFERFGEIKEGDRFISPSGNQYQIPTDCGFKYHKHLDELRFSGICLYQAGKYAKLKPKRVEVKTISDGWKNNRFDGYDFCFDFCVKNGGHDKEVGQIGKFLAKQLEKYLNGEL